MTFDQRYRHVEDWALALVDPLLVALQAHWQGLRGERDLPSRDDFDPVAVARMLPHLFLVDVLRAPLDFRYRLIGTAIAALAKRDVTGKRLAESMPAEIAALYAPIYAAVAERRRPVRLAGSFWVSELDYLDFEALLLPLAPAGGPVNMLLGGIVFHPRQP